MLIYLRYRWIASGRSTRVSIAAFHAALQLSGKDVPAEEAECLVANMIYKGFMKGYVSHERQTVVLAANQPFPLEFKLQNMI